MEKCFLSTHYHPSCLLHWLVHSEAEPRIRVSILMPPVLCCEGFPSSTAQVLRGFVTIRFFARRGKHFDMLAWTLHNPFQKISFLGFHWSWFVCLTSVCLFVCLVNALVLLHGNGHISSFLSLWLVLGFLFVVLLTWQFVDLVTLFQELRDPQTGCPLELQILATIRVTFCCQRLQLILQTNFWNLCRTLRAFLFLS
jgi:hypothetical protein